MGSTAYDIRGTQPQNDINSDVGHQVSETLRILPSELLEGTLLKKIPAELLPRISSYACSQRGMTPPNSLKPKKSNLIGFC